MEFTGKAKRVRVYINADDSIGHRPAHYALLEWLRAERAAGVTIIRGTAGLGASGRPNTDLLPDVGSRVPVIVEWIDAPDRVERLLPRLRELVGRGLITAEDTEILLYKPHGVRSIPDTVSVEQVMSRDIVSVSSDTPLRRVVEVVEDKIYRAVPVVEEGRPVGMITNLDLVERGGLLVRLELLSGLTEAERAAALEPIDREKKTAGEVMTTNPVTVAQGALLTTVAEVMTHRRLKRLPVVDATGKLIGIVSRIDLLRTVAEGFQTSAEEQRPMGLRGDLPLSRFMRKDVPAVHPETPLNETLQAVVSTRLNRALVVDAQRRVVGIVTDEEVLDRVTPAMRTSALRSLMHRLPFAHVAKSELEAEHHSRARSAKDLMLTDVAVAREDQLLRDAIAPMMKAPHKLVAVVDAEGRLVGALDRADILRGLAQAD